MDGSLAALNNAVNKRESKDSSVMVRWFWKCYVNNTTSSRYLAPSDVNFIQDGEEKLQGQLDENTVSELSNRILHNEGNFPTIQVVQKDGAFFALNNSYLRVFRELENRGKCAKMKVDVVPLSKVPPVVQHGMVVEDINIHVDVSPPPCCAVADKKPSLKLDPSSGEALADDDTLCTSQTGYQFLEKAQGNGKFQYFSTDDSDTSDESVCYSECSENDDESDYDGFTCNVCEKVYPTAKSLVQHQQKKRHYGCSVCDIVFPSLSYLEAHKEHTDHWSEYDIETDDIESDHDPEICTAECYEEEKPKGLDPPAEMERLL